MIPLDLLDPLAATPWDWFLDRFGFAPRYRGALFLLAGGMFIASLIIVTLLTVHLLSPGSGHGQALQHRPRVATRLEGPAPASRREGPAPWEGLDGPRAFTAGREAASDHLPAGLDAVFDAATAAGIGEPRILVSTPERKLLRVYACAVCAPTAQAGSTGGGAVSGCEFARGFFQASFERLLGERVEVREVACHRSGATGCDFDVRYGFTEAPAPGARGWSLR